MESSSSKKHKQFPSIECQYKTNCYRRNPAHFEQYSHPHLEKIVTSGRKNGEFVVPDIFNYSKDIVVTQCEILERIYSSDNEPLTKKQAQESPSQTVQSIATNQANQNMKASSSNSSSSTKDTSCTVTTNPKTPDIADKKERESRKQRIREMADYFKISIKPGQMAEKLSKAHPYNIFLTTITACKPTHSEPLSTSFLELLDPSLGELESSVHINFMVDINWLLSNYFLADQEYKPMLILYGDDNEELRSIGKTQPHISTVRVNMSGPFSTHHSKLSIFCYKNGSSRIVVSTANLYLDDWHNRTQGLWISPLLPPLPEDADTAAGESKTCFKDDFVRYLVSYSIAKLQPYIARLRRTDFSAVNVFFVASVEGTHRDIPNRGPPWGHLRLGYLLSKYLSTQIEDEVPVVAQSSSIGSLGVNYNAFIGTEWLNSFKRDSAALGLRRAPPFKMIYPSYSNVKNSYDDLLGGGCLPYRRAIDVKQPWLKNYLFQWRSNNRNRTRAMPHIKTYCRWSDKGLYWFLLTSANLSKAAWGSLNKSSKLGSTVRVNNYEAGVLFIPEFVTGTEVFPLQNQENGVKPFPMPYDIPLVPYVTEDVPFVMDYLEFYLQQK